MSYCVNCGVELDDTAQSCPLCHTPVLNPNKPVDMWGPKPFPTEKGEVPPVARGELALLISAMLVSVAVCCGVLNLFLRAERAWSLYVIGAAVMLWIWFVPPLLLRRLPVCLRLVLDVLAVALYVFLISLDLGGGNWYWHLALPIILLGGAIVLGLALIFRGGRRSILTTTTLIIGAIGLFLLGVELFVDRFLTGSWQPGWSLIVVTVCVALMIPLVIVRRVPSLREEVRRRFHM
ncbi:DUF6320 domain-containing protein [uncultured Pseudoflavonifractor sp.]|uniref:DUF6320 domain-containing protein n=1 Tax=uncultured Pseudoflavonifractor sp. TaxID=1221379 RepID=UPI0025CC2425|nr:DUF6320 domain-containing protein [uncultured Pseudoflavonifractor sp.]